MGLVLMGLLTGSARAQGRIATIDLRKVFDNYWKTKQADATIKDSKADMEKEHKTMLDDYKKSNEEYQALLADANNQLLSTEERDKRKKSAEDKLKQMKDAQDLIVQYERQASTRIEEQLRRMRDTILGEIRTVITAKAKANGYALVLDTAAESYNKTPIVLFSNNENDLTEAVLGQLNAGAPVDTAAKPDQKPPDQKPPEKKDDKKK